MKNLYKIYLTFLFALAAFIGLEAQSTWKYSYGGSGNETAVNVIEKDDGGFRVLCSTYTPDSLNYIMHIDSLGFQLSNDTLEPSKHVEMIALQNGDYMLLGVKTDAQYDQPFLSRYDSDGNELWTQLYQDTIGGGPNIEYCWRTDDLVELLDGSIMFTIGYVNDLPFSETAIWYKTDASGNIIWTKPPSEFNNKFTELSDSNILVYHYDVVGGFPYYAKYTSNGDFINQIPPMNWVGTSFAYQDGACIACEIQESCFKLDSTLTIIDEFQLTEDYEFPQKILALDDGSFITAGHINDIPGDVSYLFDFALHRIFPTQSSSWQYRQYVKPLEQYLSDFIKTSDGGFLLVGVTKSTLTEDDIYIIKVDENGLIGNHLIEGTVNYDFNYNCESDSAEFGYQGFTVIATNPQETIYAITDTSGKYEISTNIGNYDVQVVPPNDYWEFCSENYNLDLDVLYGITTVNFEAQAIVSCPYLEVDISVGNLRRCLSSTYFVNYCNSGSLLAEDASIEVILDGFMRLDSTSIPISFNTDSLYVFDIGDIDLQECGTFKIYVTLDPDCDETELGETYCVEAKIYPDTICTAHPSWSGANVELEAECGVDSLSFFIQNTGTAPNSELLDFVIIEDEVILRQGNFNLEVNEIQVEKVPANGSSWRMVAQQEPFHPVSKEVSIDVEGCGENGSGEISTGFVNQYSDNDDIPSLSIDCAEVVGSFDPNDKKGYPTGYGQNNYIDQNTSIEYKIRFQNTGTDTAFTVVVVDTLSAFLNPASVRAGASSHNYSYSLSGDGIIEFRFENIMLPDSNVNEVLSNGFVKFEIDQFTDIPRIFIP